MSESAIPVCVPNVAPVGCCLEAVPDTSSWQVVCAGPAAGPTTVPVLSEWGALLFGVLLVAVAMRRLR